MRKLGELKFSAKHARKCREDEGEMTKIGNEIQIWSEVASSFLIPGIIPPSPICGYVSGHN